jgi:hypothetical protein
MELTLQAFMTVLMAWFSMMPMCSRIRGLLLGMEVR